MAIMLQISDHQAVRLISHAALLQHAGDRNIVAAALCYRVLGWMLPVLSPRSPPRQSGLHFRVAFGGPGILDCLRLVAGERVHVDPSCAPLDAPEAPEGRFYFEAAYGARLCSVYPRRAIFPRNFLDQVARFQEGGGTPSQQSAYQRVKRAFAGRLLARPAEDLFQTRVWSTGRDGSRTDETPWKGGRLS